MHLLNDGRHEAGDELAQVQRHVLEHDQRRAAEAGRRASRAQGGAGKGLVVVQRGVDAREVELVAAAHIDRLHRQRGLQVNIGHRRQFGHDGQALRHRRADEGGLEDCVTAIAAGVAQINRELAVQATRPTIVDILQLAVQEHHVGVERGTR